MAIESTTDKNLSKLEAQLDLWNARLKEFATKATAAGKSAKIDSRKQIDDLKAKLVVARSKLDEAKAAGGEKWDSVKGGVVRFWKELEDSFKTLTH
jgi:hypothetical protein